MARRLGGCDRAGGALADGRGCRRASAYVGAQACEGCHTARFDAWKGSHHALAMQKASEATVLGNFANAKLEHLGVTTTFFRNGDKLMVRTEGPDGALHDYPIAYTFGVHPLQQYLIAMPGGRLQALGIAWDSRPKKEGGQRWFHLYPGRQLKPGEPLHWTGRDQIWNYQCADCHSNRSEKELRPRRQCVRDELDRSRRRLRGLAWSRLAPRRLGQGACRGRHLPGEFRSFADESD